MTDETYEMMRRAINTERFLKLEAYSRINKVGEPVRPSVADFEWMVEQIRKQSEAITQMRKQLRQADPGASLPGEEFEADWERDERINAEEE